MPSGAKKRKAAKKKLQDKVHNFVHHIHKGSHSHSQGSEDPKIHDGEGGKEVSLGEGNFIEDGVAKEFKNGNKKSSSSGSSSSGSSSSSDNDEVEVEKEKSSKPESGTVEASFENSGALEVVNEGSEESIPIEESVKQVVSSPQVSTIVSDTLPVDNSSISDVIELGLKPNVDEVIQPLDEKIKVASGVEKIEEKVIQSEPASVPVRDDEGLFPQSSGVKAVQGCCGDDHCKASETQKSAEEQPLLSSAPIPVQRTSWLNCCGLFEVFSGGSGR